VGGLARTTKPQAFKQRMGWTFPGRRRSPATSTRTSTSGSASSSSATAASSNFRREPPLQQPIADNKPAISLA
jgi:hypothetical protein